jgi:hypothetical protein
MDRILDTGISCVFLEIKNVKKRKNLGVLLYKT